MEELRCASCGATSFITLDGFLQCEYCGTRIVVEKKAKAAVIDFGSGPNGVNHSKTKQRAAVMAAVGNIAAAKKLYLQVIAADPTDEEATRWLAAH